MSLTVMGKTELYLNITSHLLLCILDCVDYLGKYIFLVACHSL